MEHRFNRKQCHTELATFIVQRSITLLQGGLNPAVPHELDLAL